MKEGLISFNDHKRNNQIYINLIFILNLFLTIKKFILTETLSNSDQQRYLK